MMIATEIEDGELGLVHYHTPCGDRILMATVVKENPTAGETTIGIPNVVTPKLLNDINTTIQNMEMIKNAKCS